MTSIEFRPIRQYTSPLFSTQKSARRAVRDGVVTASVTLFVPQRNFLFLGLTDGKILYWETDRLGNTKKIENDKPKVLSEHRGSVRSIIFVESVCNGVMFTGSADRSIRMWDMSNPSKSIPCVHTLYGHLGTVLALEYGSDTLLSSSTDGFMCVWRDQTAAKLLRFPTYSIRQKMTADKAALQGGLRAPKETWFLCLSIREGEVASIFAGDTDGYAHIYKSESVGQETDRDSIFLLAWKAKIHDLGISKLMSVPMESFMFTLSFDQKFKALDSVSGQVLFEESNQANVVFNGLAWDSSCQEVIVGDARGNVGFYNLIMESCVAWKNVTKDQIIQIHYEEAAHRLLVLSPHVLSVFDIVRGVKFSELNEHTGPVISMASRPTPQGGLLYTAAMDNTIRMWDTDTLECIKYRSEKKNEITAMVHLPSANVIVTGHENADIKMWSLDSQQEAYLRMVSGAGVHTNTISTLIWVASADQGIVGANLEESELDLSHTGWETLVAGSYDRQLSFWKVTLTSDGISMAKFERAYLAHEDQDDEILAVAYSPAARAVFTGGNSGIIRKWAFMGVKLLEDEYESHEDAVTCFAVDGNFLYSGSSDCTVRIWETSQGYQLKVVTVHKVTVQSLLIIPDSGYVASCAFDGRVVFWDPQISEKRGVRKIQTYEQHEEFRSLSFVDLNNTILVGCESGKIISFPLPSADGSHAAEVLPKSLDGIDTPPSSRGGDTNENDLLEQLRSESLLANRSGSGNASP